MRRQQKEQESWTAAQFDVPAKDEETRFHDLGLDDRIMHGIADLGFQYCTPIQAQVMPHTLQEIGRASCRERV